ncbi:hypothetical protein WAI453_010472 [Rhynchosporium graminicola]
MPLECDFRLESGGLCREFEVFAVFHMMMRRIRHSNIKPRLLDRLLYDPGTGHTCRHARTLPLVREDRAPLGASAGLGNLGYGNAHGITVRKWPTWLISFSEATRYTPEKAEAAREWCQANDRPIPKHLLYPRTKGFVTTIQHLRKAKHVKAVYDMTIAYEHNNKFLEAPTIWESLSCGGLSGKRGYKFHVHFRRFPMEDLPETEAELSKWLETRWVEKGEWLKEKREEWAMSVGHVPCKDQQNSAGSGRGRVGMSAYSS